MAVKTNIFYIFFDGMIFGVIPHLIFNKTHLITGSSKIISGENLEKFGAK